jgi:hypothetical protein
MTRKTLAFALMFLLAACSRASDKAQPPVPPQPAPAAPVAPVSMAPVSPPEPGTPGGLPDDRTPISEAPFTPESAQGAANVVQTYYALIGEGKYAQAWALWGYDGKASGQPSAEAFARSFDRYVQYNAQIGAPGEPEGAAGSIYVSVPVVIYGRLKSGAEVHEKGTADLRRVNNVDGSTAEQRRWHISRIETKPTN